MKLVRMEFESEQDRDAAIPTIIAIREKQPEPALPESTPFLMVWESERAEFERRVQEQGIRCEVAAGIS